ncbi:hypothetical protein GGI26_004651 [Coemansia sp. RSA 1358]|uniref:TRIP4/RQT4 C2HC5-type zinc finger domain-containing protein n=1 Tax=Coemansia umbellata TaxID=1424467 RepID=A0ABQ8PLK3_9FUNG|nr:hypothetical protein BX070DRAFT_229532 [Coemansia spiralis]KAJ1991676.1 hypothetical protein EDC05_003301 [Coemansia umbellata]KAJ2620856.1 hypothetical protein GGI26_004651 [Coemansia sp. RSA 1358]
MERTKHELTSEERNWAARQIALVVGASEGDAEPLAEFLVGIEDPNELQNQLFDMLGESPLALDFAFALIAKRFPPVEAPVKKRPVPLPPVNAKESRPQSANTSGSRPQSRKTNIDTADNIIAYRKADPGEIAYFTGVDKSQQVVACNSINHSKEDLQKEPPADQITKQETAAEQKSQRQLKKEKQQQLKQQKEEEMRKKQRANRKRIKCECQASEHLLLTNCLTCGRIICDSEGPGPCMFCDSEVESPNQQLQQHMRRMLRHSEQENKEETAGKANTQKQQKRLAATGGTLYSMKAGGGTTTREASLLWDTPPADDSGHDSNTLKPASAAPSHGKELSEEEYLQLAFKALGIDKASDPGALQEAEAWVKATRRKERLLDYDRTAAQRTKLIDQLSDFDPFAVGKWMSPDEKVEAERRKQEHLCVEEERESRLRRGLRVLRLNFQNGSADLQRPGEDENSDDAIKESSHSKVNQQAKPQSPQRQTSTTNPKNSNAVVAKTQQPRKTASATGGSFANNPLLGSANAPKFVLSSEPAGKKHHAEADDTMAKLRQMLRIQTDVADSELQLF